MNRTDHYPSFYQSFQIQNTTPFYPTRLRRPKSSSTWYRNRPCRRSQASTCRSIRPVVCPASRKLSKAWRSHPFHLERVPNSTVWKHQTILYQTILYQPRLCPQILW